MSIKVGLNSSIPLTIHHVPRPSALTPTILYLPRGPVCPLSHPPPLSTLALSANATVVCIDYRLSNHSPYPTPIHDVLAGYDWVQENLIQQDSAGPSGRNSKIGVCGELIGGSLAMALALTECRAGRASISAAWVGNPVVDWTSLALSSTTNNNKEGPLSHDSLLKLREDLFHKPEHYHDPFASPLLFFRTPAISLPDPISPHDSVVDEQYPDPTPDPYALGEDIPSSFPLDHRKRRSHRKYPPAGSALRLPHLRIEVGAESGLTEQGKEMVELLLRSVKYWEEESYGGELGGVQALKEKIELIEETESSRLWHEEKKIADVGEWMGKVLRL